MESRKPVKPKGKAKMTASTESFPRKSWRESPLRGPCQTDGDPGSRREAILQFKTAMPLPLTPMTKQSFHLLIRCCGVLFRVVVEDQTLGRFAKGQIADAHDPEVHHQGEAECSCYHLQGSTCHDTTLFPLAEALLRSGDHIEGSRLQALVNFCGVASLSCE